MVKGHGAKVELVYREYKLSTEFPVLALFPGEYVYQSFDSSTLTYFHFHNCIEIGMCLTGGKDLFVEDKHYTLNSEEFFIIPPYSIHFAGNLTNVSKDDDCCQYLYLDPEALLKEFYPNGLAPEMNWYKNSNLPYIFSKKKDQELYELCSYLFKELKDQQKEYTFAVKGLFLTFFAIITRIIDNHENKESTRYRTISAILPAIDYINKNYTQKIQITDLAKQCYMSTAHFRTVFQEAMQQSPLKYLTSLRLQKACELLYSTEATILDIAMGVGFQSVANFNRLFKDFFQTTPTNWRNNRRAIHKKYIRYSPFFSNSTPDSGRS